MTKISKAAMRRAAREAAASANHVPELSPELAAALASYRPERVSDEDWQVVSVQHRAIMRRSGAATLPVFEKYQVVLCPYLVWRHDSGESIATKDAMTFPAIDDYYRLRLADRMSPRTANDYRSRLRKIAQSANPGVDAPNVPVVGHQPVKPGYSAAEAAAICRVSLRQRRPQARRVMCAVVGLCMGAGLGPQDLRPLVARDVVDLGPDGIRVDVPGPLKRTVWVRHDYEELVRVGIDGLQPGRLVIGQKLTRKNITPAVVDNADAYDCPTITTTRLRSTWLSWLMTQPVPLAVVLDAAGLTTARSLTDLLPTLDTTNLDLGLVRGVTS